MSLRERIQQTLDAKDEITRKTVTITLDADVLEKVDQVAKAFTKVGEKTFSRNSIIEEAIGEYINEATNVLLERGIDIEDEIEDEVEIGNDDFDTAIFPAHNDGFKETFLGKDCWYSVRIKEDRVPKIKYVAIYRAAPISGVTHYAKVKEVKQYQNTNKKIIIFDGPAIPLPQTVILGETNRNAMRASRYTTLAKLINANVVKELFPRKSHQV